MGVAGDIATSVGVQIPPSPLEQTPDIFGKSSASFTFSEELVSTVVADEFEACLD